VLVKPGPLAPGASDAGDLCDRAGLGCWEMAETDVIRTPRLPGRAVGAPGQSAGSALRILMAVHHHRASHSA